MLVQVNHNHNQVDSSLARSVFTLLTRGQLQKSSGFRSLNILIIIPSCHVHLELAFLEFFLVCMSLHS